LCDAYLLNTAKRPVIVPISPVNADTQRTSEKRD
jgi:hypothetical protein